VITLFTNVTGMFISFSERRMIEKYNQTLEEVAKELNHKSPNTAKVNYIDPRIAVAWYTLLLVIYAL
jgi:hypothetical protein